MSLIPCMAWVKRGVAAAVPEKVKLTTDELIKIINETKSELENDSDLEEEALSDKKNESNNCNKIDASSISKHETKTDEYNFDKYDDESDSFPCMIGNIVSLNKNGNDPLIESDNDKDSDEEDDIIKPDDNLLLVGHVEGDASILEVYVYNEREESFYCHHDLLIPSFPLCIEWLNFDPGDAKQGNFCAIGSMSPIIDVWDLDLIDCLEPAFKLGSKSNKKKNRKRVGHKDAVLDVAWNENYTHVLASGSADQTTILWDLENCTPVSTFNSFNEKVQCLKWHPSDTHNLLTGCADKVIRLFDCKNENIIKSWTMPGEIEKLIWNPSDTNHFLASTDNGYIGLIDMRSNKPIWQIHGHEKEVIGLCLSSLCNNSMITSSSDGSIKVWNLARTSEPEFVWETKSNLGNLLCLALNPDNTCVFAVGGDNKAHNLEILDLSKISEVYNNLKERNPVTNKIGNTEDEMDID